MVAERAPSSSPPRHSLLCVLARQRFCLPALICPLPSRVETIHFFWLIHRMVPSSCRVFQRSLSCTGGLDKSKGESQRWMQRHIKDEYVRRSNTEDFRARSAYKLLDVQKKHKLLREGMVVVECGAAPGAWTQVATNAVGPAGLVVACDLLPLEPVQGALVLAPRDFTLKETQEEIRKGIGDRQIDVVLSDMAPSNPGLASVNHDMTLRLVYSVLEFSVRTAAPESDLLVKIFAGSGLDKMIQDLERFYSTVRRVKPESSRKDSAELFLLAQNLRPRKM